MPKVLRYLGLKETDPKVEGDDFYQGIVPGRQVTEALVKVGKGEAIELPDEMADRLVAEGPGAWELVLTEVPKPGKDK